MQLSQYLAYAISIIFIFINDSKESLDKMIPCLMYILYVQYVSYATEGYTCLHQFDFSKISRSTHIDFEIQKQYKTIA